MITSDQIRGMTNLRLKYLTHDARDVVVRSKMRDDLALWHQVNLIELCANYSADRVLGALTGNKTLKSKDKDVASHIDPVWGATGKMRARVTRASQNSSFSNEFTLSERLGLEMYDSRIVFKGGAAMVKLFGEPIRNVLLSPQATFNLWVVDSKLLAADWTVRLETLADLLSRVTTQTLEEVLGDCNYPRMSAVLADLEAFFGSIKDSAEALRNAPTIEVLPVTKVDPEVVKKMQEQLQAFDDMIKAEKGES
jgi:hypothetical protein